MPTPSTSQQLSPLQAFLKGPEKAHRKKSQVSPSTAFKCGPLKICEKKSRAFKQPRTSPPPALARSQQHASKSDAETVKQLRNRQESSTPSPSQFSPPQVPDEGAFQLTQMDEEEEDSPSQSMLPEPEDDVEMDSPNKEGEDLVRPPHSSAQKMLFFELDRKRKAPAGLPSLAVECMGPSRLKLKAGTPLEKPRSFYPVPRSHFS